MTHPVVTDITNRYLNRTKTSQANDARAKEYLPGGDTRTATYFFPYPTYMVKGEGCYVEDADGNRYIDFANNFTSLIHGHAHPDIVAAVKKQVPDGTVFATAATVMTDLAQVICERVPGIDMVRFSNSGTEATMMAMRAARAFTGKDIILKIDGGFHGTHDFAEVNQIPDMRSQGMPVPHVEGPGIPVCVLDGVMVTPFNDLDATESILEEHGEQIAAIIMEPIMGAGGGIEPAPGYLKGMRQLADKYGVLLIFDEIITLRTSLGGMQLIEGVTPDLTTVGKIIGGGFAIGAFGGRREIMELFDPARPQRVRHSGTFNGHNVAMAAGLVAMHHFDQAAIDRLNRLGDRLMVGFNQAFQDAGIKGQARGLGSICIIHWTNKVVRTSPEFIRSTIEAADCPRLLHLEMLNRGVFAVSRGMYSLSTPMTEAEVDTAIGALGEILKVMKPYIADETPHLLR